MIGDRFTLTVGVSCKIHFVSFLYFFSKLCEYISFSSDRYIFRFKIIININAHLAFRQITHMTIRRNHFIITA